MARTRGTHEGRRSRAAVNANSQAGVPAVYKEMLADAVSAPTQFNSDGNTIKKRRIAGRMITQNDDEARSVSSNRLLNDTSLEGPVAGTRVAEQQTAYQESEDSIESDLEWEEVDIVENVNQESFLEDDATTGELDIVLGGDDHTNQSKRVLRRKPVTSAERKLRLEIHKMHLLTLMIHIHSRNYWCNDENVHAALRNLLPSRTISCLNPDEKKSQFQRSRSFIDGLSQASEEFRGKFKIVARGLSRPYWAENLEALANVELPKDLELPMRQSDFLLIASELEGSRDVGVQIFCALLRSVGVDARLVCSLQPLPLNATTKGAAPTKPISTMIMADPNGHTASSNDESEAETKTESPSIQRPTGSVGGRSRFSSKPITRPIHSDVVDRPNPRNLLRSRPKRIRESPFPVYWVEAFNEAVQKWVPVDPLTTRTVSKPSKIEPPASDSQNNLSYVLAFEDDGSARDVTRRYAKAYNAKTRKARVEATKDGEKWWRRVLKIYRRSYELPRDQVENSELAAREAAEGMPRNVMDFKNHPYYALERHLKRREVIHPKREVGKVGAGRGGGIQGLEPIFRRRDVHVVKSADSWYRQGREVKIGEQPLKHVPARRSGKESKLDGDDPQSEEEAHAGTALYAAYQTAAYSPPPVVRGRIPKNIYGNLDIYVPSMVPPGGSHISHPETARAARILGIDYADAVTGFAFKGRHGTAVITGAVVATACREAVEDVIRGLEEEATQQEETRRSVEALRLWRRFLKGLRVRARIEGYEIEGEREVNDRQMRNEQQEEEEGDGDDYEAGGFFPDVQGRASAEPTAETAFDMRSERYREDEGGGFLSEAGYNDEDEGGGFIVSDKEDDNVSDMDEYQMQRRDSRSDQGVQGSHIDDLQDAGVKKGFIVDTTVDNDGGGFEGDTQSDIDGGESEHYVEEKRHMEAMRIQPVARSGEHETLIGKSNMDNTSRDGLNTRGGLIYNEDDETSSPKPKHTAATTATQLKSIHIPPSASDTNLPDDELAEAFMLQQVHESGNMRPADSNSQAVGDGLIGASSPTAQNINSVMVVKASTLAHKFDTDEVEVVESMEAGEVEDENNEEGGRSSEEDAGSLISHDPEDEDADPEWLA